MKRPPMAHRVDTRHPYTHSTETDIRKTFARVLAEQKKNALPTIPQRQLRRAK